MNTFMAKSQLLYNNKNQEKNFKMGKRKEMTSTMSINNQNMQHISRILCAESLKFLANKTKKNAMYTNKKVLITFKRMFIFTIIHTSIERVT